MPAIPIPYCSLEDIRAFRDIGPAETADDNLLEGFAIKASALWERLCRGRKFYPTYETRYFDHPQGDGSVLALIDADLLEVDAFTTNNGAVAVTADQYYPMCGDRYDLTPFNRLVMKSDSSQPNLLYSGTPQKANAVTGWWGYHNDWANAFVGSGDALAAQVTTTGTTLTVSSAAGADLYGVMPRFKVQGLLKIGTEYLYVTDKASNSLTVVRGVNGTTAAAHSTAADVYVYRPIEAVRHAATRLAVWMYQQRSSPVESDRPILIGDGTTLLPTRLPKDVTEIAAAYVRRSYR